MLSLVLPILSFAQPAPVDASPTDWVAVAEETMARQKARTANNAPAKNVILFVADGMDVTTVTAARIYAGQAEGKLGEDHQLTFEGLPWVGLSKTYNTNMQTPDSAGTATAMVAGVKTKAGVINVDQTVPRGDCAGSIGKDLPTMMDLAGDHDKSVGVVSTARITHATPAAVYSFSADRNWEADRDLPANASACKDIASQLIDAARADELVLALGGGRRNFLPAEETDPEYSERKGARNDERNLITEWNEISDSHKFVWNGGQLAEIDASAEEKVLGLFEPSHMQYDADRSEDPGKEPSLADMTAFAIDRLNQDDDGFFLLVEGGRVDHAHHAGNASRALQDVLAFDAAVSVAMEKTDTADTLIIVTSDHGHTLVFQGYPQRGNPILGVVKSVGLDGTPLDRPYPAADGKPYTTLVYGNGPGSPFLGAKADEKTERPFVTDDEAQAIDYRQQSIVPSMSETHGGQDVAIYARGPMAHLLSGVVEQHFIYHVMKEAITASEED